MTKFSKSIIIYSIKRGKGVEVIMLENMEQDMRESVRLIDSLYVDLITDGLRSESAKNKLISMYERILKVNVTVTKESTSTEDFAGQIIGYYCDLCHATSSLFEYYRKMNSTGTVENIDLLRGFEERIALLNERIENLESELYQRDVDIEALEKEIEDRDNLLVDKFIKAEYREKFRTIRKTWTMDKDKVSKQLAEKDSIIERLKSELNKSNSRVRELEAVDKIHDSSNPAKRIDVKDEDLVALYLSGESPYKIGKRFNMSQSAVIYRLDDVCKVYVKGGRDKRALNRLGGKNNE